MGFGDDFLAKRYAAGWKEGYAEGLEIGRAELLKFLKEHPDITAEQIKEWARNGEARRNGDGGGKGQRD